MGFHSSGNNESQSVSPAVARRGCVLAIDYGRRRLGLAISDALDLTARPLVTMERKGQARDLARLRGIAREHGVKRVIVGHPLRMDGTPGDMADEAARFARRVERTLELPVKLVDERLTSWAADEWLAAHPQMGRGRANDEIAAAILLQEYLDRERGDG
jgi:putative Holliday junction resolvase